MPTYKYLIKEESRLLPILFSKGDVINIKEVFGIKSVKEAYRIDEAIWRRDENGMYCELWIDEM